MQGGCPGSDMSTWTPDDIFEIACPRCGYGIEFFKDDPRRRCHGCGMVLTNPRLDVGCAAWCPAAAECGAMQAEETTGE